MEQICGNLGKKKHEIFKNNNYKKVRTFFSLKCREVGEKKFHLGFSKEPPFSPKFVTMMTQVTLRSETLFYSARRVCL